MRRLVIACITGYQRFISPFLPAHCRFTPTCSEYMLTAIQQHGTCRGLWLGLKRLGRCHPFGSYGYDPVPQRDAKITHNKEPSACSQCGGSHNNPGDYNG